MGHNGIPQHLIEELGFGPLLSLKLNFINRKVLKDLLVYFIFIFIYFLIWILGLVSELSKVDFVHFYFLSFIFLFSFLLFSILRTTQVRGYLSRCHISHNLMA